MAIPVYLQQFKAAGVYRVVWDKSEITNVDASIIRLVVGYSEKGPFNIPVYVSNSADFKAYFGEISKKLEKRGVYFHRLALEMLKTSPILCLNLKKFSGETVDAASISTKFNDKFDPIDDVTLKIEDVYTTTRFWELDATKLNGIKTTKGSTMNSYINISHTSDISDSMTYFIRKACGTKVSQYNITVNDWYSDNTPLPEYLEGQTDALVSDFFAEVYVFKGKFEIDQIMSSSTLKNFFTLDENNELMLKPYVLNSYGETMDTLDMLFNDPTSNPVGHYIGALIPNFQSKSGNYISLDIQFNVDQKNHHLMMSFNDDLLEDTPDIINISGKKWLNADMAKNILNSTSEPITTKLLGNDKSPIIANIITLQPDYLKKDGGPINDFGEIVKNADQVSLFGTYYVDAYTKTNDSGIITLKALGVDGLTTTTNGLPTRININCEGDDFVQTMYKFNAYDDSQLPIYAQDYIPDTVIYNIDRLRKGDSVTEIQTLTTIINDPGRTGESMKIYIALGTFVNDIDNDDITSWFNDEARASELYQTMANYEVGQDYNFSGIWDFSGEMNNGTAEIYPIKGFNSISYDGVDNFTSQLSARSNPYDMIFSDNNGMPSDASISLDTITNYKDCEIEYNITSINDIKVVNQTWDTDTYAHMLYVPCTLYKYRTEPEVIITTQINVISEGGYVADLDTIVTKRDVGFYANSDFVGDNDVRMQYNVYGSSITYVKKDTYVPAQAEDTINNILEPYVYVGTDKKLSSFVSIGDTFVGVNSNVRVLGTGLTDNYKHYIKFSGEPEVITLSPLDDKYFARINSAVNQEIGIMKPKYLKGYEYLNAKPASTSMVAKLNWQKQILSTLVDYKGLRRALLNKAEIDYRYIVDTFESYPDEQIKSEFSELAKEKQSAFCISNFPAVQSFVKCPYMSFTDENGIFNVKYVVDGSNNMKPASRKFSLPDENAGASFIAFYTPIKYSDGYIDNIAPSAGLVSNLFVEKYMSRQPYYIVAGPNYGRIRSTNMVGPDYRYSKEELNLIEPFGVNCLVYRPNFGTFINANQTAKQTPVSALSRINVRELVIYLQDEIEKVLQQYQWEFNNSITRSAILDKANVICELIMANGGIQAYRNIMDESNNTPDIIDNEMAVLSTYIEPGLGCGKMVQELTIYRTGQLTAAIQDL